MTNLPVTGKFKVTCEYHRKGNTWKAGHHTGIDLVSDDKRIFATCNGKVDRVGFDKSYGNYVIVKEDKYYHWFCHLASITCALGDKVTRITVLGIMGKTGNATGVHLHYEIRKECNCYDRTINPADYMGIPNKVGEYNSKDFQIQEYKIGEIVYIPIKYTGAEEGNRKLIELGNKQFWVYSDNIVDKNKLLKVYINWVEENRLMVNCDAVNPDDIQFWIDKSEVIK